MTGRLEGKVALVTGAGSSGPGWGNGKAAAVLFAREGARVFAVDIDAEAATETSKIIEAEGGECHAFTGDVSSTEQVAAMVDGCLDAFGGLDVLHNNVGISHIGGLEATTEADWERLLRVNLTGMFLTCQRVVPIMAEAYRADGKVRSVVNVGAVAGRRWTGVAMIAYAVSKGAVEPLTRSIALEYARSGVRCNCILPGLMDTPFVAGPMASVYGDGDVEEMIRNRDEQSPTGRMGTGWDVAHAALFLASPESNYVTGHALAVDGGQSQQTIVAARSTDRPHDI